MNNQEEKKALAEGAEEYGDRNPLGRSKSNPHPRLPLHPEDERKRRRGMPISAPGHTSDPGWWAEVKVKLADDCWAVRRMWVPNRRKQALESKMRGAGIKRPARKGGPVQVQVDVTPKEATGGRLGRLAATALVVACVVVVLVAGLN